ncbi:hypothetical protein [Clostridium sp. Cult2]|nr:hypothetical protein [Clostridium sp. Cult2]
MRNKRIKERLILLIILAIITISSIGCNHKKEVSLFPMNHLPWKKS